MCIVCGAATCLNIKKFYLLLTECQFEFTMRSVLALSMTY